MRAVKAVQARMVLDANDNPKDVELLSNYAQANGMTLLNAANEVLKKESEFAEILLRTEIQKDRFKAKIREITNFEQVQIIRDEIYSITHLF